MIDIRKYIEWTEALYGEQIETIVCDGEGPLSRDEGIERIAHKFAAEGCRPFYAWSKSRVFMVHEYNGTIRSMPRDPTAEAPAYGGDTGWETHGETYGVFDYPFAPRGWRAA